MLELFAIALTIGAIFYRTLHADWFVIFLLAFSCAAFLSFLFRSKKGILFSVAIGATVVLGALAVWRAEVTVPNGVFGTRAFDARVRSVDRRLDKTNLIVRDAVYGVNVQVSTSDGEGMLPGDVVSIRALINRPESFLTQAGRLFDYPQYLESRGIVAVGNNAQVVVEKKGKWSPARFATTARFAIADIFSRFVSFPTDGVLAGMTVGYQGGIPADVSDLFRVTGVLHVLVLSGYNITLLAGFLTLLLKPLPFKSRTIVTIAAIALLVLISGSGIASIRAGIMGGIALFAGLARRTYQPLRALTLAYVLFFVLTPTTIFSDPGFHLSFLATAFMILVLPKVETIFSFVPRTKHVDVRELLMLALTVPIFMLPYTMYFSGLFPLASPFANIVLAVVTPLCMVAGVLLVVVSFIIPIGQLIGTLISSVGSVVLHALEFFSKLPSWNTPEISWWIVVLLYGTLLYILFKKEIRFYLLQLQNSLAPVTSSLP